MLGRAGTAGQGARRMLVAGAAPAVVVASGLLAVTQPAAADEFEQRCGFGVCDDDGSGSAEEGYLTVEVEVSGSTAGEDGYDIPGESVWTRPPCYYAEVVTGKVMWDKYRNTATNREYSLYTLDDLREHKDDDEGYWWEPMCSGVPLDEAEDYQDRNPPVFVEPGDPIPVPEIEPEFLMEVAQDAMELPDPEVSWNPKRAGDGATLVNVDTWFWLDDGLVQVEVQASAGGNTATVEATLDEMGFSSPAAETVICDGFGTEWSPDATDPCVLKFQRSSASMPGQVTPVDVESHWSVEWFYNGELQEELEPQTTEQEFQVPVAEAQSRVVR